MNYENISYGMFHGSDQITGSDDLAGLSSDTYNLSGSDYFMMAQEDCQHSGSPASSAASSPKPQQSLQSPLATGNRARAHSLNTKSPHSRSTAHITQQQMNKKRQRATPEQLVVLEEAFTVNPSPNAKMREQISTEINMTERSVQIWFQNRRAKTKLLHRKGGFEENGFHQVPYGYRPGMPIRAYSIDHNGNSELIQQKKVDEVISKNTISRLNCRSLTIGSWRRVSCTSMDLICYFSHTEPKLTYYINSGQAGFKIEFALRAITKIDLRFLTSDSPRELGRVLITLMEPPAFFMEAPVVGGWKQCTDFTENQQATKELTHAIVGPYSHLKSSLTELASVHHETTALMTFEDLQADLTNGSMNAMHFEHPIPTAPLPRSQAFHPGFATPDLRPRPMPMSASTLDIPNTNARNMHRRTRSRSAPIAVDFSQMMTHQAVGGMPGYSFGQQSLRIDPSCPPHTGPQTNASSASFDYPDALTAGTPTTAATPNFQDQWYNASYASTPLLDGQHSSLTSPITQQGSQFDPTGLQNAFVNGYAAAAAPLQHTAVMQNDFRAQQMPTHSIQDLQHLQTLANMPPSNGQFPTSMSHNDQLDPPLGFGAAPMSIDEMDFGDLQATQAHNDIQRSA